MVFHKKIILILLALVLSASSLIFNHDSVSHADGLNGVDITIGDTDNGGPTGGDGTGTKGSGPGTGEITIGGADDGGPSGGDGTGTKGDDEIKIPCQGRNGDSDPSNNMGQMPESFLRVLPGKLNEGGDE